MPSACPGFAAVIPALPDPAPVWPVGEDCMLAPRSCCFFSSWANTATQSCNINKAVNGDIVNRLCCSIAVTKPPVRASRARSGSSAPSQHGIFLQVSRQDMGSVVYQRDHRGFRLESVAYWGVLRVLTLIQSLDRAARLLSSLATHEGRLACSLNHPGAVQIGDRSSSIRPHCRIFHGCLRTNFETLSYTQRFSTAWRLVFPN